MLISVSVLYQCPSYYKNTLFISYSRNKLNSNEKEIFVVCMRTSKREVENNYRKDDTDTDTLARVKLEPTDDLLEQEFTNQSGKNITISTRDTVVCFFWSNLCEHKCTCLLGVYGYFG